jgi:hypothetical protein
MPDISSVPPDNATTSIRITGLNKDNTRKTHPTDSFFQVYFELSRNPSQVWKNIFEKEWKSAAAALIAKKRPKAYIDRGFLAIHCPIMEVGSIFLPALKKAVAGTNTRYQEYEMVQLQEHLRKESIWKKDRSLVDEIAKTLTFD